MVVSGTDCSLKPHYSTLDQQGKEAMSLWMLKSHCSEISTYTLKATRCNCDDRTTLQTAPSLTQHAAFKMCCCHARSTQLRAEFYSEKYPNRPRDVATSGKNLITPIFKNSKSRNEVGKKWVKYTKCGQYFIDASTWRLISATQIFTTSAPFNGTVRKSSCEEFHRNPSRIT